MLSGWFIALLATAYLGLLFAVARFGDARADAGKSIISANVYALSVAVYCTSWTFYGSVGRATSGGLSFLTIYIGPTLMLLCVGVIIKMIRISKAQRITSIADFIASRYGKSQLLAGMVTVIAVIGVVPYIALQLKAMAASVDVLLEHSGGSFQVLGLDSTFLIAVVLALFSILFGTRHLDATERHEGMVAAVAFESVVKIVAFMAVGIFVTYGMFGGLSDLFQKAAASADFGRLLQLDSSRAGTWTSLIILSGLAIIFLPRQFQIIVVENVDESHLKRAVWLFPLYLLLINIFVLPLALGGLLHFDGQGVNPDTFVLTLPNRLPCWPSSVVCRRRPAWSSLKRSPCRPWSATISSCPYCCGRPAISSINEMTCRGSSSASVVPPSRSFCCWATSISVPLAKPMRWLASV